MLFILVTMVVSVSELQTHTSVGVQQAMEAPTVRWVSSAKLIGMVGFTLIQATKALVEVEV